MEDQKYGDLKAAMIRYGVGRRALENLARASNARSKIGSRVLYNYKKMDQFLDRESDQRKAL